MDEKPGAALASAKALLEMYKRQGIKGIVHCMLPYMPEGLSFDALEAAVTNATDGPCVAFQPEYMDYVEQLVMNAEAAVAALRERGVSDHRLAVGGHSYGAFMTANL